MIEFSGKETAADDGGERDDSRNKTRPEGKLRRGGKKAGLVASGGGWGLEDRGSRITTTTRERKL